MIYVSDNILSFLLVCTIIITTLCFPHPVPYKSAQDSLIPDQAPTLLLPKRHSQNNYCPQNQPNLTLVVRIFITVPTGSKETIRYRSNCPHMPPEGFCSSAQLGR